VERFLQALDDLDDLVAMLRQRWLRHAAEQLDAPHPAPQPAEPPLL
jgi:hypothetical protein